MLNDTYGNSAADLKIGDPIGRTVRPGGKTVRTTE